MVERREEHRLPCGHQARHLPSSEREGRAAGGSSSHHHQSVSKLHFSIKSSQKLEEQSNDFMIFDSPVLRVPNYSL